MIDLPLRRLKPGMTIAQSVYNSSGANYLTRGMPLTSNYIEKLRQLGIQNIHVLSTSTNRSFLPPEDVLEEKTRAMAVKRVYDVFQQVRSRGTFDINPMAKASASIVNDIMERRNNLVQLTDIRSHDMYTFAHCVNVAMLSTIMGVLCGFENDKLSELTLSALLHDLGKISIPLEVLNKQGRLTDEEFAVIKNHPVAGYEHIQRMNLPNGELLSVVARQHHEKMDGTGYPDHRKGPSIHIYGRIGAIADVYDALTSTRPYKKAYSPSVAYNIMARCSPGHFDEELLKIFFSNVAIYPIGTVLLTNRGYAIVSKVEFGKTERPVIRVFANKTPALLPSVYDIDLSADQETKIENVISDTELFHFIHQIHFDPADLLSEGENL